MSTLPLLNDPPEVPVYTGEFYNVPSASRAAPPDTPIHPLLQRRASISVSNPSAPMPSENRHRPSMWMDPRVDSDLLGSRVESLRTMRPFKLIGASSSLIDWEKYRAGEERLKKVRGKKGLSAYYSNQNELIDRYEDVDKLLGSGVHYEMIRNYDDNTSTDTSEEESEEETEDAPPSNSSDSSKHRMRRNSSLAHHQVQANDVPAHIDAEGRKLLSAGGEAGEATVTTAIYVNFAINIVLLLAKVVVAYSSNSMSIMASLVDSVLDFLSTLIIFFANKYAAIKSARYPVGRRRLEPIGVLVFSIIIIISFLQVLISSVERLFSGNHGIVTLSPASIAIMVSTILAKFACYVWCNSIKSSSVQALAQDAKTDVVFNTFSLIFPLIEWIFQLWWVDALGASLLCLYVISEWGMTTLEHIQHLCGSNASQEDYSQILYLVLRFSDNIAAIKNYNIYHQGDLVNVEVDIVISNRRMNLRDCHDLGESLQYAMETLPFVERCFVHLDYKVRNYIGHLER